MSWGAGWGTAWSAETDAQKPMDCANFRCHFGDVPKAAPPLIAEPYVSFYRDAVVKPMRPYRDWEPTARQLPNAHAAEGDVSAREGSVSGDKSMSSMN